MPELPLTKLGLVRCRDLVQLYYGARMVVSIIEDDSVSVSPTIVDLLLPDPRRIKYEIILVNADATAILAANIGTPAAMRSGNNQQYRLPAGTTIVIERDFITDLESVTLPLQINGDSNIFVSTRQTFLTPLPVDEPV